MTETIPQCIDLTTEYEATDMVLQRGGSERIRDMIQAHIDAIEFETKRSPRRPKSTDIWRPRVHRAILVEGGRGSGKTSFLLSQLERLRKHEAGEWEIGKHLQVLPIIDPTLIETKDNIIIMIVQMIEAAVDEATGLGDRHNDPLTAFDKAKEALAGGLAMLDGIGHTDAYGSQWEDANWVMSEGLRKARKGQDFELKLSEFFEKALAVLGKQAFVLAFDDVDTNFKHGHMILETMRKYLTSPRLVLILSGDLDLYGRLVRGHVYDTFGEKVLKHDGDMIDLQGHDIKNAVRELEEQYLLKIVPPQNRIRMLPLGGLPNVKEIHVGNDKNPTPIRDWLSERIRKVLGEEGKGEHPFVTVALQEHLRLVLSYMRALDWIKSETGPKSLQDSRSAVLQVLDTRLRQANLRTERLHSGDFNMTLRTAFEWISRQAGPGTLVRFGQPASADDAIVLHGLAVAIAQGIDRPGRGLREVITLALPAVMLKRPELAGKDIRSDLQAYLWNEAAPFLPETAARISAIDRYRPGQSVTQLRASSLGTVGVVGVDSKSLRLLDASTRIYGSGFKRKAEKLETWHDLTSASAKRSSQRWLEASKIAAAKMPKGPSPRFAVTWFTTSDLIENERCGDFGNVLKLVHFERFSQRGGVFRSVSALSLLAVICTLLEEDWNGNLDGLASETIIPAFGSIIVDPAGTGQDDDDDTQDEASAEDLPDEEQSTKPSYIDYLTAIQEWREFALELGKSGKLGLSVLGAVANRLHDDWIGLDATVERTWGTGDILHRQIAILLNAFIAETDPSPGQKASPKTSDGALIAALRRNKANLHPEAVILLSCPLIWAFLRPEQDGQGLKLVTAVREALMATAANAPDPKKSADSFNRWTKAPLINVEIGQHRETRQLLVPVHGFFDLLNVVPRYVDDK